MKIGVFYFIFRNSDRAQVHFQYHQTYREFNFDLRLEHSAYSSKHENNINFPVE